MNSRFSRFAITIGAAVLALAGTGLALASGPGNTTGNGSGNNGRAPVVITCDGTDYTIAVPQAGNSNGVGQIVDEHGHGIPATGTFTVVDVTTSMGVFSGPFGHPGHRNQEQTECTATVFDGVASDFFGSDLPPGVAAGDHVVATLDVFVVLKL